MADNAAEVKQKPQGEVKPDEGQSQAAEKGEKKAELKPDEAKKLVEFMAEKYDEHVAKVDSFDDFYHAIYELIQKFCEERGQVQYRIPAREKLQEVYKKHHTSGGEVKREEFAKMSGELVKRDSFSFGKATTELLMFLFGAPMCALVAKRVLPGLGWVSDDTVIPLATSGAVAYLVHSKKL
ncbi:uncharacterized protein LOC119282478 [Triticum dicoccoides]|uniref:uncharacterized protein LOC119282478 n=1 Tax=Triticum dicoccoides TaxID=85692 RepID=UPI000E795D26|nr:uncharacterized protein LOC119282478 [Triticum dicoccoides]